jgi:hypothetical protein
MKNLSMFSVIPSPPHSVDCKFCFFGLLRKDRFCLFQTGEAHSWTCMDLYVFATPYRITWDYYFSAREHTLKLDSWEEPAELEYVFFFCVVFCFI